MGWLADGIADVNSVLTAAWDTGEVHTFMPERLVPPAALILFGNPMLEDGETFGDQILRFNLVLVLQTGTNETMTTDLIATVEDVVFGLIEDDYTVENVGQPYTLAANNANYLAVNVSATGVVRPQRKETP